MAKMTRHVASREAAAPGDDGDPAAPDHAAPDDDGDPAAPNHAAPDDDGDPAAPDDDAHEEEGPPEQVPAAEERDFGGGFLITARGAVTDLLPTAAELDGTYLWCIPPNFIACLGWAVMVC